MKLAELGEFGLIDRIAHRVAPSPSVPLGIGDDAAALLPTPGALTLITSDMLLEGVHFDLAFCDPQSLGRKSLAVNLSDLAAMGAHPRQFLLGIALPAEISLEFIDGFMAGIMEQAERFGVTLVGGDTCASRGGVAISITALGEQRPERVVKRSGASAGDLIYLSGTVGDAAAGLGELRRGVRHGFLVARQLDPQPRVAAGVALAEAALASAMIDVSDGVLADLGHICELSGVGARVELARLPLSDQYRADCGADPFALALSGGEDYELLFCTPRGKGVQVEALFDSLGLRVSRIGEITKGEGVELITPDGGVYAPALRGFDHFG
ncbi:MAG: thiamine-phosphate kinase [Geobacteraceae bacterium GWC2_58_44]|nr:MAG: thiamine-phosphate kinase [Geobacteraceae bacterium GWC2_58_44]